MSIKYSVNVNVGNTFVGCVETEPETIKLINMLKNMWFGSYPNYEPDLIHIEYDTTYKTRILSNYDSFDEIENIYKDFEMDIDYNKPVKVVLISKKCYKVVKYENGECLKIVDY
jgi:hypothetical protein